MKKKIIPKPTPAQALEGFKMLTEAYQQNHQVTEQERTKREQIAAYKEVELAKISSQKEILQTYLSNVFAERKEVINKLFDTLDQGIQKGDTTLIQQSLAGVVAIAKESPLSGVQSLLNDYEDESVQSITI